jgi:WD40 repeat protein
MNFCFNINRLSVVVALLITPLLLHAEQPVSFKADLAPILLNQCQSCHGPKKSKGGYRVDTFERAMEVGFDELHYRIVTDDEDEIMPPDADPLPADKIALFKRWQEEGETFDGDDPQASLVEIIPGLKHPEPPSQYSRAIPVTAVAFAHGDETILSSGYHEMLVWAARDGKLQRRITGLPERIHSIDIHPDGKQVVVAGGSPGRSGEVRVIDLSDGSLIQLLHKSDDLCLSAKFNLKGTRLATCGTDGSVRVFDSETWQEVATFANHSNWVNNLAWSAGGNRIVTGSKDNTAKVFDLTTNRRISTYTGHDGGVYSVTFDKTGEHVVSACSKGKVMYWRAESGQTVKELADQSESIYHIAVLDSAEHFIFSGAMPAVEMIDLQSGKTGKEFTAKCNNLSLAVSNDSGRLLTGDSEGGLRVFDIENGELITGFTAAP